MKEKIVIIFTLIFTLLLTACSTNVVPEIRYIKIGESEDISSIITDDIWENVTEVAYYSMNRRIVIDDIDRIKEIRDLFFDMECIEIKKILYEGTMDIEICTEGVNYRLSLADDTLSYDGKQYVVDKDIKDGLKELFDMYGVISVDYSKEP